ncbi:MAG: energy transducer TonB [Hyphomonadaceae bacterium]|nr:energy transducer TonB [Hyphomonadaceae bacterium]
MHAPKQKPAIFRMRMFAAAAVALAWASPAFAQDNPVVAHYRVYRAALERNDLAAAETAADAALQASVVRDGQGGRTGILAINLAKVRLSRGKAAEAYAPALQAFNISAADPGVGVDALLARLVLGRSELTDARWREGRDRLRPAIEAAEARPDMAAEGYTAAAELGRWLNAHEAYQEAITAWTAAGRLVESAEGDKVYALAEARLNEGVARFLRATAARNHERRRPNDTRIFFDMSGEFEIARARFAETQTLLREAAHTQGEGLGLSLSQQMYAAARAWSGALWAYAEGEESRFRPDEPLEDTGYACAVSLDPTPRPDFPPGALSATSVGAVVLRVLTNERDEVVDIRVAAAVPSRWFKEAVERVASQWRLTRTCPGQNVSFTSIRFYFRS